MRRLLILGGAAAVGAAAFAACSLDLDESLIDASDASLGGSAGVAGSGGSAGVGGSSGTGATGGTGGVQGDAGPCDADPQCQSDAACIEGRCAGGQCLYELCPSQAACEARSCDTTTSTCTQPTTFGFKAGTIELDDDIGCAGVASRCIAGFGDLVFVATSDGSLHAWRTTNPATPQKLTVDAPTFPIARMVASETRLLLLSNVSAGKLQLAWVDAPTDPKATSLTLTPAGVNFAGGVSATYPAGADSFLIVQNDANSFYPAALVQPPVPNNATVTQYPSTGLFPGSTIVASSGSRLVSYRVDSTGSPTVPKFTLIASAGTSNAQNSTEKDLTFEAPTSLAAHYFHSGYEGSVLWSTNSVYPGDAGGMLTTKVVLRWPFTGSSNSVDESLEVDVATYSEDSWNVSRAGPLALIDPSTVLVTVEHPAGNSQTRVIPVTRSGNTLSLGSAQSDLPFDVGSIGVAANRKVGFVLTPSSTAPALKTTLHIFAPACG